MSKLYRQVNMELKELVAKTFTEDEIFELLVFEVEENFEHYLGKHFHLNFSPLIGSLVKVTEMLTFRNADESHEMNKANLDKVDWIEITNNFGHIDIMLTYANRSHRFAQIYRDKETFFQSGKSYSYAYEWGVIEPLTEEELREGFAELAGCLEAYKKSKSKIAG